MNYKGMIGDFNGLEFWFENVLKNEQSAKWNLYRGHQNKVSENRANLIYRQEDKDMGKEESFDLLKQMIEINAAEGGDFTIYIPQVSQNTPNGVAFFRAPNTPIRAYGHSAIAGLPNSPPMGIITKEEVAAMIQKEREVWEKDRRIEELEAELDNNAGLGGVVMQQLTQDGTLGRIVEMGVGQLLQIVGNFVKAKTPALAGFQDQAIPQDGVETQAIEYDSERIVAAFDKMIVHFKSLDDFYNALDQLAIKFNENPPLFKTYLGI